MEAEARLKDVKVYIECLVARSCKTSCLIASVRRRK